MNVVKKILNVFGILFSIPLCFILVAALIVVPFYSSALSVASPKQLVKVVQNVDLSEIVVSTEAVSEAVEEIGLSEEAITDLLDTGVANELLALYAEDVANAMIGNVDELNLTADNIKSIVNNNMEEIVTVLRENLTELEEVTDDEITGAVTDLTNELADTVITELPSTQEIAQQLEESGVSETIRFITSPSLKWGIAITVIVLALILYGLRFPRFKGMAWVGACLFVAGLSTLGVASALKNLGDLGLNSIIPAEIGGLAMPAILTFSGSMLGWGIGFAIGGVALIAGFITIRVLLKKKKAKVASPAAEVVYTPVAAEQTSESAE